MCCRREMTLISPLCMFTQTNVRWKRLFCTIELPSAVELAARIATHAAATHQAFLLLIILPFPRAARAPPRTATTFRRTVVAVEATNHSRTARSGNPNVST